MIYWLRWSSAVEGESVGQSYFGDDMDDGEGGSDVYTIGDLAICTGVCGSFTLSFPFPTILAFCSPPEEVREGDKREVLELRNAVEA